MFFEAMESRTRFATKRKLAAVLKLDPRHVRSLVALALMESSPEKSEAGLRAAIAEGERRLGARHREFSARHPLQPIEVAEARFAEQRGLVEQALRRRAGRRALRRGDQRVHQAPCAPEARWSRR